MGINSIGGVAGQNNGTLQYNKVQFIDQDDELSFMNSGLIGQHDMGSIVGANNGTVSYNSAYSYISDNISGYDGVSLLINTAGAYYGDILYYKSDNNYTGNANIGVLIGSSVSGATEKYNFAKFNYRSGAEVIAIGNVDSGSTSVIYVNGNGSDITNVPTSGIYSVESMNDKGYGSTAYANEKYYKYKKNDGNDSDIYVIREAEGVYRDSENWENLVAKIMKIDFSWNSSAEKYASLYDKVTKN